MKENISALMDGELDETGLAQSLHALHQSEEALEAWREYHLISDALQDTTALSAGFSARFADRLAQEPTVLAPKRPVREADRGRWMALSAAASFAAVALVGWLAFAPQAEVGGGAPIAQAQPAIVEQAPLPSAANDYLLAHQAYSPRNNLQGVAPYVRTVSEAGRQR